MFIDFLVYTGEVFNTSLKVVKVYGKNVTVWEDAE